MDSVENISENGPVIIGFGTRPQAAELRRAGADKVFTHPDDLALLIDHAGITLRPIDTLLMVQPSLLNSAEFLILHKACKGELTYQVVGHEAYPLKSKRHFSEFRKLRPIGVETEVTQFTGRPRTISYSEQQAEAIIKLWHETPRRKPADVVAIAKTILELPDDLELKTTWVRDLVIKYVGTAQRDKPEGWNGISTDKK